MNKLCVSLAFMMLMNSSLADIYKWIDRQGNVHFSDTPRPGAERLDIPEAQSFSPPMRSSSTPERMLPASETNGRTYTRVAIVQPENEATIRNNDGFIAVSVQVEPELFPGDKLQMVFDSTPLGEPQTNLLFQMSGIYRGSHTIAIQIIDAEGTVLETSDPITVFMFRPRVGMVPGTRR